MTMVLSGDGTITGLIAGGLPDATIIQADLASNVVGNGPIFSAYKSGAGQSISNNTSTKITFDTENFDTNNNFASSRFTPTVAGYYVFTNSLSIANFTNTGTNEFGQYLFKNGAGAGSGISYGQNPVPSVLTAAGHNYFFNQTFGPIYANGSTDYFEIYLEQNTGGTRTANSDVTAFAGWLVRSA